MRNRTCQSGACGFLVWRYERRIERVHHMKRHGRKTVRPICVSSPPNDPKPAGFRAANEQLAFHGTDFNPVKAYLLHDLHLLIETHGALRGDGPLLDNIPLRIYRYPRIFTDPCPFVRFVEFETETPQRRGSLEVADNPRRSRRDRPTGVSLRAAEPSFPQSPRKKASFRVLHRARREGGNDSFLFGWVEPAPVRLDTSNGERRFASVPSPFATRRPAPVIPRQALAPPGPSPALSRLQ